MKIVQPFLLIIVVSLGFAACMGDYGKEYKLDALHNVYYKGDGAKEADAIKLANFLKSIEYFQDSVNSSVQFEKIKDTFNLNFVVDATKLTSGYENNFLIIGAFISDSVFNNAPVTVQLTNGQLEPFKNLGYAKPLSDFDK